MIYYAVIHAPQLRQEGRHETFASLLAGSAPKTKPYVGSLRLVSAGPAPTYQIAGAGKTALSYLWTLRVQESRDMTPRTRGVRRETWPASKDRRLFVPPSRGKKEVD